MKKLYIEPKHILVACVILCFVLIAISFKFEKQLAPAKSVVGVVFTPMQKGVNTVGKSISNKFKVFNELLVAGIVFIIFSTIFQRIRPRRTLLLSLNFLCEQTGPRRRHLRRLPFRVLLPRAPTECRAMKSSKMAFLPWTTVQGWTDTARI